ncbi:MAG: phosphoketolase family protein [Clostridiales bacterium]|nr:phosphoketolase family protein [Clostridiales bacterium]
MKKDNFSNLNYFKNLDKYFRATNYLSVAQLYLLDNPLLRDHKLNENDIKKKLVGHWGTIPGQNFVYAHCNRAINKYDLNMILLSGPGHGGNFFVANSYLEGVYSDYYPKCSMDKVGMKNLCKQFSFPGGIGSHCVPETPGSINEGGELGYSLAHGFGAVFDNPDLIATVIVGDGEAETGPLATSWHSIRFLNPVTDGAVLPILHLNGYKISNPTLLSRLPKTQLKKLLEGYGYAPVFVEGDKPMNMHKLMAQAMDKAVESIKSIQENARNGKVNDNIIWPMIVLRTPKGWTGPKVVDGNMVENSFRAHQIPIPMTKPEHIEILEKWLLSYKPDELFDENYRLKPEIASLAPKGNRRISANPITNGGLLLKELKTPNIDKLGLKFKGHGTIQAQDMLVLGEYIKRLFELNKKNKNYRIFSPDEAMSNRLYKAFEVENRSFNAKILPTDEKLSKDGRIMDSFLSEHMCEGWLEGYLLTGRHGLFDSYEAFIRVVDSMVAQHAKWLKVCNEIEWRKPISSLNLILTSNVWQQDHNGFTHQDPGFIDHIANKKADVVRVYLPADANCLLSCYDHCAKSKNYVNVITASKHPTYQWLSIEEAKEHCFKGASVWEWACLNDYSKPDVVIASCGDTATVESLATVKLIKEYLPNLNVRFVNVVDLMKLVSNKSHPHGLTDAEYDKIFTKDTPIIFNFHGYPQLIHTLTYNRHNQNLHVSGYNEEGTITTSFDMRVLNKTDRFNQMLKVLKYIDISKEKSQELTKIFKNKLKEHYSYIREYGIDLPEIRNWNWND